MVKISTNKDITSNYSVKYGHGLKSKTTTIFTENWTLAIKMYCTKLIKPYKIIGIYSLLTAWCVSLVLTGFLLLNGFRTVNEKLAAILIIPFVAALIALAVSIFIANLSQKKPKFTSLKGFFTALVTYVLFAYFVEYYVSYFSTTKGQSYILAMFLYGLFSPFGWLVLALGAIMGHVINLKIKDDYKK